jgi:glycosyltransferase involved in cell wall biosynthesis
MPSSSSVATRTAVVLITRNRRARVLDTLRRLRAMPDAPLLVVVDNASGDGTPGAIAGAFPDVRILALSRNAGAAGRNVGVLASQREFVAFADDDSWWADGSLVRAEQLFDAHRRLSLIAANLRIGPDGREDPVCQEMRASPLSPAADLPGPRVLGFVACATIVRRDRFLDAGGFAERFGVGGEERLLAIDMTAQGNGLAYVEEIVAWHDPEPSADRAHRPVTEVRNALWSAWLRRRPSRALGFTLGVARRALRDADARSGLVLAARDLRNVLRERSRVSRAIDDDLGRLRY